VNPATSGFVPLLLVTAFAPPPTAKDVGLEQRLATIAAAVPGRCAIVVKHLRTGDVARVHANARVPLMSVAKLPIALVALHGVDEGRWSLATRANLRGFDMNPTGVLADRHPHGGVALPVRELIDLMLTESDNSASDVVLRLVGGTHAVNRWLSSRSLGDVRVDRTELQLGNDWYGLAQLPPRAEWNTPRMRALRQAVPASVRDSAARAFAADPRDQATPEALVRLLERLWRGELLSPAMTDTAKAMLARCATGAGRLPAELPRGTRVARKTGTGGTRHGVTTAVNDVGVIRMPVTGDEVAIAVLIGDVRWPIARAEDLIARAARAVVDVWDRRGPGAP
jgi:beta-lactamase class A